MTPRVYGEPDWSDRNPGCHTHASGFGYVPWPNPADKEIDKMWAEELDQARIALLSVLKQKKEETCSQSKLESMDR
jgi:hypothetical protein